MGAAAAIYETYLFSKALVAVREDDAKKGRNDAVETADGKSVDDLPLDRSTNRSVGYAALALAAVISVSLFALRKR